MCAGGVQGEENPALCLIIEVTVDCMVNCTGQAYAHCNTRCRARSDLPMKPHRLFFALKARFEGNNDQDASCAVLTKAPCSTKSPPMITVLLGWQVLGELGGAGDPGQSSRKRKRKLPELCDESYVR